MTGTNPGAGSATSSTTVRPDDRAARWLARDAVALRQMPSTVVMAVVLVIVWSTVVRADRALLLVSAALVVAAQLAANLCPWHRWPYRWRVILPLAQVAAITVLDAAASQTYAQFDILLVLPLSMLALRAEHLGAVVALVACAVVLLTPVVVDIGRYRPGLHAIVTFLVIAPMVLGAHVVVRAARKQADDLAHARDEIAEQARALRRSRDDLRSILEAATEQAIVATDAAGVVVAASSGAERILARPADTLVGSSITALVGDDADAGAAAGPDGVARLVGRAAHGGTHVEEWRANLPDGTTTYLELVVTARPSSGSGGAGAAGYLVVATDVSARRDEQRRQDEFIGLISHELRTPLASIIGYLDILQMDPERLDEEQARYLDVMSRNAARLRSLVDDLLTSAQLAASSTLSVQEVDVVEIVRSSLLSQGPIARASGVRLEMSGESSAVLTSDPQLMAQVVDNLVSNAIKYSFADGTVTVEVRRADAEDGRRAVRLRVVDEGTGIEKDELARLTERFYRSRATRRRRVRGAGLGLSLVQTIVDEHDGTLTIDSAPGEGTRVEVVVHDLPRSTS